MGLLSKGTPLEWSRSVQHHAYVKYHGILQFLAVYAAQKGRADDQFLWGDEVEHLLLHVSPLQPGADVHAKRVQLSLRAADLIEALESIPEDKREANFLPEFGRFMIEATPAAPYGGYTADLRRVEANMRERRALIEQLLQPDERLVTLTAFPLLGMPDCARTSDACSHLQGPIADSDYVPDEIIGAHPRFATLVRNIRTRRGARVDIRVPLFQDANTAKEVAAANAAEQACLDQLAAKRAASSNPTPHAPRPADLDLMKEIHMDAMPFGMGMCCLQVTFQTRSINEARHLYDHLAVLSPIMLALTAATPFFRGRIGDIDVRWSVISQSVDDRTPLERGLERLPDGSPVEERNIRGAGPYSGCTAATSSCSSTDASACPTRKPQRLYKSRYDGISTFLSTEADFKPEYNDLECEIDEPSYKQLLAAGVDELLARHVAHLFVRDPLVIYDEHIQLDDAKSSDHFENIQSTNWQTVRFKPPTPGSTIGWRVEFRTMEVQVTDFENAAFTVFIALVSRALLYFNLNLYIPLSKVDANLERAHRRDAVNTEKFFWRKNVKLCGQTKKETDDTANATPAAAAAAADGAASASSSSSSSSPSDADAYEEMSLRDIMLGSPSALSGSGQPGLINLVRTYLDMIECDAYTRHIVDEYLDLISRRATGELMTTATWLRKYVQVHPAYTHGSMLNQEIVRDIVDLCGQIVKGTVHVPQLLGEFTNLPKVINKDGTLESQRPSVQLKGAEAMARRAPKADGTPVFDLNEPTCCEKLKQALAPYLQKVHSATNVSSSNGGSSSSTSAPSTPPRVAAASVSIAPPPQSGPAWKSPAPQ